MFLKEEIQNKINIVIPHQEKLVSKIPFPYPITWLIIGGLVFFVHFLTLQFYEESMKLLEVSIILSILICFEGGVIIWASKELAKFYTVLSNVVDLSKEDIIKWYNEQLKNVFNNKRAFIVGLIIASGILLTVNLNPSWPSWFISSNAKISFNFLLLVVAYLMGAGLYVMIMTAVLVDSISKLPLRISIYQHPTTSIKALGYLLLKFSFCGVIVYSLWISAILYSPLAKNFNNPIILLWIITLGIIILSYFIIPQYKIHKIMVNEKHEKLRKLSSHSDEAIEPVTKGPTAKNTDRLRGLLEIQQHLNGIEDWPFNMKSIISLLSAVIIPILAVIINIIFSHPK